MTEPEFQPWPKLPRLNREIVVTEKIDGTNAAVGIMEDGRVYAQSRTRLITPGKDTDNHGFAAWVEANNLDLLTLGVGLHFGEWWGPGVNKRYTAHMEKNAPKVFSLFNTHRWVANPDRPYCCDVVPVLYQGPFSQGAIDHVLLNLRLGGSEVVPGAKAEGIVVYHTAARSMFKVTLEHDEMSKGEAEKIAQAQS